MTYTSDSAEYSYLLTEGWTKKEIESYIPYLLRLDADSLLFLHEILGLEGYTSEAQIEHHRDTAIWALVNPLATPKDCLMKGIKILGKRILREQRINAALPPSA